MPKIFLKLSLTVCNARYAQLLAVCPLQALPNSVLGGMNTSSQPLFTPSNGLPLTMSKQDESHLIFANGKHLAANQFSASPRASPALSDRRNSEAGMLNNASSGLSTGSDGPRFNVSVFRSTFGDEQQGPIVRAQDPIAPDQREPFITVDSPPSSLPSASFKNSDGERQYPPIEMHSRSRERSVSVQFDTIDDNQQTALPASTILRQSSLSSGMPPFAIQRNNSFSSNLTPRHSVSQDNYVSSSLSGPPVTVNTMHDAVLASSPVSSVSAPSASSAITGGVEKNLDNHIRNSPFLHDILDRVIRTEYAQRDLARELGSLASKINLLVERLDPGDARRSFSSSPVPGGLLGGNNGIPPLGSSQLSGGREEGDISKRLDALTMSVQQILMIQQQNHLAGSTPPFNPNTPGSNNAFPGMNDLAAGGPLLGHSNRPHGRNPPPIRTWSAGSLDMPLRQEPHLARPDALLNQKRRSVAGNLTRRDSSATIDSDWGNNSPRDSGPTVTKWEHLQLVPELLRSISKYGVGPPNKIQQRALPFLLNGADIIAQAPPTQERIAAYVIPAIHIALSSLAGRPQNRGPIVVIISTTVDQATQAQRMIRDLGGAIGVRSALGVGTGGDVQQEIRLLQQNMPHILCGTPQKLHSLFTTVGGLPGNEVRFLVLDEVDQLIARNLHDFVFNIVKLLPPSRPSSNGAGNTTPIGGPSSGPAFSPFGSPGDASTSPGSGNNASGSFSNGSRRFPPLVHAPNPNDPPGSQILVSKRQTALFSNTVPQDVLNLANAIQLRDPVRVLVRRDGNVTSSETHKYTGGGLKQFYLYLAFTASGGRADATLAANSGLGIIGSGRGVPTAAETAQAKEWKLEALSDLFDDVEIPQTIVHVGSQATLDAVVYKLASRGLEAIPLHSEMNPGNKVAALSKFRGNNSMLGKQQTSSRVLVVCDVPVKSPDVFQIPLVINYDLPRVVEDYAHRVAPAMASSHSRPGVVVNFVTATGGDVEMLRSIECFYKIKCPEVPMTLRDVL